LRNNINSNLKLTQIKKLACQKNQSEFEELEQIKKPEFFSAKPKVMNLEKI
jgi:hypothetical protein